MPNINDADVRWYRNAPDVQLRSHIEHYHGALETLRGFGLEAGRPRAEVLRFAGAMETKLRENDHRGGWQEMSPTDILYELYTHADKLADEMTNFGVFDVDRVIRAAADVANFAMFAADVAQARTKERARSEMIAALEANAEELESDAQGKRLDAEDGRPVPTGGGLATPDVGEGPARRADDSPAR